MEITPPASAHLCFLSVIEQKAPMSIGIAIRIAIISSVQWFTKKKVNPNNANKEPAIKGFRTDNLFLKK